MCGIAGQFLFDPRESVSRTDITRMCDTLIHRGPDDKGVYLKGPVGLGHRRLSIIDLDSGRQPIANEDRTVWVVFNGEIYNYVELREFLVGRGHIFSTATDTEVIVHLYEEQGEQFLSSLRGMFAIALWDERVEALDAYLNLLYVPAPLTMFEGIQKLPAGHLLTCSREKSTVREYWDLHYEPTSSLREGDLVEALEANLRESVRIRLRCDVPIGAFLSGGVDSSSVVAVMAQLLDRPVVTCAVGFQEEGYNELPYAREVADRFSCTHHEHLIQPDVGDLAPRLVRYFDEPFGDSSAVPTYYVSQIARQYVTVALWLPPVKGRETLKKMGMTPDNAYAYKHCEFLFNRVHKLDLYSDDLRASCAAYDPSAPFRIYYNRCDSSDPLDKALYVDVKTYLADDILVKVDRMSMAHALEVRAPLLDHKLLEFTATIPSSFKLKGRTTKYLLKQVMRKYLPSRVLTRKKHGFTMPVGEWLKGPLRPMVEDCLFGSRARQRGLFNPRALKSLWANHHSGKQDYSHHLWMLLMFELWHRAYLDHHA